MKLLPFLLRAAAVLPSTLAISLAYVPWDVPNNDIKHVIFPMNIAKAPHQRGYYFVQYFILNGQVSGSYIGLQPQDDGTIRAAFSTFINGSTTSDGNCRRGAKSRGVNCLVDFRGTYAHTYNLDVRNSEGSTWTGTVIDTVTGISTHIGTFTLLSGSETTLAWHRGLVVYLLPSTDPSTELPNTSVKFGVPKTDAGVGILKDPYEAAAFAGHDNFKFTRTADNEVDISVGSPASLKATFRSQTQPEEDYGIANGL